MHGPLNVKLRKEWNYTITRPLGLHDLV